ncbi:hypothetical protein QTN25_007020 [Entamoeba marina]
MEAEKAKIQAKYEAEIAKCNEEIEKAKSQLTENKVKIEEMNKATKELEDKFETTKQSMPKVSNIEGLKFQTSKQYVELNKEVANLKSILFTKKKLLSDNKKEAAVTLEKCQFDIDTLTEEIKNVQALIDEFETEKKIFKKLNAKTEDPKKNQTVTVKKGTQKQNKIIKKKK